MEAIRKISESLAIIPSLSFYSNAEMLVTSQSGNWVQNPKTGNAHKATPITDTLLVRVRATKTPDGFVAEGKDTIPIFLKGRLVDPKQYDFTKLIVKIELVIKQTKGVFILYKNPESSISNTMNLSGFLGDDIYGYWLT